VDGGVVDEVTRVVLGLEEPDVAEEILHFLDRSGRARVVGTASDERQLSEAIHQLEPDAVVASPGLAPSVGGGGVLLTVDTAETVGALRGAIRAGARGFYVWPTDREQLAGAAARALTIEPAPGKRLGHVAAVYGPRGGVGTTFVATHLAAALAKRGRRCVLVDLDLACADVTHAVGAPQDEPLRTIGDLFPIARELAPQQLEGWLWSHSAGFHVVFAPSEEEAGPAITTTGVRSIVRSLQRIADVVVLHVPRGMDDLTRAALASAERVFLVLRLDALSFRAAKRAIAASGIGERCAFVVNAAGRSELTPRDVEQVLGSAPVAVIPVDRNVRRAQDRGRILPLRGRTGRGFARLAARLEESG
jgi:pilus assembly protein CpaE